jgi:hypothetical protein
MSNAATGRKTRFHVPAFAKQTTSLKFPPMIKGESLALPREGDGLARWFRVQSVAM